MNGFDDYHSALMAYIRAYETLTADNLKKNLLPLMADNVYFEDPFNQVVGPEKVAAIFEHMFCQTQQPQFQVISYAINESLAFLRWEFDFKDSNNQPHQILGVSKLTFDDRYRVLSHIDYWDTGKFIYQKVPLLGWAVRRVNAMLSAPNG